MTKIEEVPLRELLYQLLPKNGVGAELGVQQGINAVQLFHCSKPKKMYLVDLWELKFAHLQSYRWDDWTESIKNSFADEIQLGKVKLHKKDRLDFLSQLEYIDTKKEAELLIKKVKSNGYIAFHDFTIVSHAWGAGVVRAVIERINTGELLATHITNEQFPTILCKNIK
jgi:hypothetical protein